MKVVKRRLACPQTVQHIWDAIVYIRQQKQIPNFDRISSYMRRKYNLKGNDLERQLNFAVRDNLVVIKKSVGCKGSKVGVEQDGYRLPDDPVEPESHDWYCFECHRGGEVVLCSTCHRVYHTFCIKEDVSDKFICCICKAMKSKSQVKIKKDEMNALLSYTCLRLKEKTRELHKMIQTENDEWKQSRLIYRKMDLLTIEEKTQANSYKSLEEFQSDAQNIVHNIVIYFGVHSVMADMARQMLRDCIYDLGEIRQCHDCYRMSNEKLDKFWFCQPCNPPHELVWARQKGFPYWPAKIIKQKNETYDVRFFGGYHQRAIVDSDNIKPINTSLQKISVKRTASLNKALEELKRHQELIEKHKKGTQICSRPTSSSSPRSGSVPPSRTRSRKISNNSSSSYENTETPGESMEEEQDSEDESPSSSSQKTARIQMAASPDDHNVVSSSSQESPLAKVSVCTQTPKKLLAGLLPKGGTEKQNSKSSGDSCTCSTKYSKILKEFKERLENEHKQEKNRAVTELAEKLRTDFEEEKQTAIKVAFEKLQKEVEKARQKAEEQLRFQHEEEIQQLIERHQQEVSEIKKKQWCYNCEAEAIYHCCWNVSYCSLDCQQVHWHKEHKRTCRRKRQ
ncbi:zinc finger MYND domain-containing protein 11-like isoform X2 [Limulus polyphemus]|uniref:Zinc finger MYND domain-containing protein 11-like isoform X2 n=1 Tax=Limulus polyphemus TaxID=6850 RepID=A0ABM1TA27_LIMPO|nr:zinc finger MYND domain-containing protein 11-like isoform X2 [Limulus polyphemus]